MARDNPNPDERVCFNCEHMLWLVALGLGVRCKHPANHQGDGLFAIPSRRYSCEHFEARHGAANQGEAR